MEMAKQVIQSFSYPVEHMATIAQAEDLARKQGRSFSKYILKLIEEDLEEQKNAEALTRLPITTATRQSSISEYDIYIFQNSEERLKNLKRLSKQQQTKIAVEVTHLRNQIEVARKQ